MSFNNSNLQPVYFGIGRRKTSVAKVTLIPGTGSLTVNQKPGALYLNYNSQYISSSKAPLTALGLENSYDIYVNTHGGGYEVKQMLLSLVWHARFATYLMKIEVN
jgi:small subunit ribosomal protein S9